MQNSIIKNILNKISQKYPKIDTILLFGSALDPGWTKKSDIDLYFIDNNINDGRIDLEVLFILPRKLSKLRSVTLQKI